MTKSTSGMLPCECADRQCPVGHGDQSECGRRAGPKIVLYRVDMADYTGTIMCEPCADDAMESGLFTSEADNG